MFTSATDFVAQARGLIREITPHQVSSLDAGRVLIDVREPSEFDTGRLPGAINIPRGLLEFQVDAHPAVANVADPALSHKDQVLVLYCRTGGRSALATQTLQRMGFTNVYSMAGGINEWAAQGQPVVSR